MAAPAGPTPRQRGVLLLLLGVLLLALLPGDADAAGPGDPVQLTPEVLAQAKVRGRSRAHSRRPRRCAPWVVPPPAAGSSLALSLARHHISLPATNDIPRV